MRKTRAKTPNGILKAAARLIRERGWCQNAFTDAAGRIDISHAIALQTNNYTLRIDAIDTFLARVDWSTTQATNIPSWNDVEGRTVDEVLKVLEGA